MPIEIPTSVKIRRARILTSFAMARFQPLVGEAKFSDFNAGMSDHWLGSYTFIPQRDQPPYTLLAWATKLKLNGAFYAYDPAHRTPFGGIVNGIRVDGAGQTGSTLDVKDAPTSATPLVAGDYVQVGVQYFRLIEDLETDGDGKGTLTVWPSLRSSPANNAAVITDKPVMVAMLTSPPPLDIPVDRFIEISIAWREDI